MKVLKKLKQISIPYTIHLNKKPILVLDSFTEKSDVKKFDLFDDRYIGGDSSGVIVYKPEDQAVSLFGQIVVDKKKTLETEPYVGMKYQYYKSINLAGFKKILLTMRTDGQMYKVQIGVTSSFHCGQHLAYGYIVDQSREWNTYALPFDNFEHEGFNKQIQSLRISSEALQLYQFQILKESKTDSKVAVQIKDLAISNVELTAQELKFTRPIFYKHLSDQKIIDTGRDKYNPPREVKKDQQTKASINSFYE